MAFLIGVIILIIFIIFSYLYLKRKIKNILGINISNLNINEIKKLSEDIPKSVGSLDSLYLDNLKRDFPDLNINEIKRMAEKEIINYFDCIENKSIKNIKNDKIKSLVRRKINDLKDKNVKFNDIKIHNTVLNKYENDNKVATIYIAISLEYKDINNDIVQKRYRVEYIYIVDAEKVPASKKNIGLNCPNCGSPLKKDGISKCLYCGTHIVDIVKRVFICNNIEEY